MSAICITVSVMHPDHAGAETTWFPGELEIDLFPHDRTDPLAPNRLDLLKQLSEAAADAYRAEYLKEHGIAPNDEHPLIAVDEENR